MISNSEEEKSVSEKENDLKTVNQNGSDDKPDEGNGESNIISLRTTIRDFICFRIKISK